MDGSKITNRDVILDFILAGKATFLLRSSKTGTHYAYKVTKKDTVYFVKVDHGYWDFKYIGFIKKIGNEYVFKKGKKGTVEDNDKRVLALMYILNNVMDDRVELWHLGTCGKCGRPLTDPKSIEIGIGPTCRKLVY